MLSGIRRNGPPAIVLEPLPCREEAWFLALPPERRAEMIRDHEERWARVHDLARRERALPWREAPLLAGVWAIADLACRHATAGSVVCALALGGFIGWASVRIDASVNTTVGVGLAAFMAFEYVANGGWSASHLLAFPAVGIVTYFVANRREDRFTA